MQTQQPRWYLELVNAFDQIADSLGLGGTEKDELRAFMVDKCKEQYMNGNRSGIKWARTQSGARVQAVAA